MAEQGGCHCGAVRYEIVADAPTHHALCHCTDCRKSAGAPMVSWSLFPHEAVTVSGETASYASSEHVQRLFCPTCGTGLFYVNEEVFPGQIDVQSATLDNPDAYPVEGHIQTAERIVWMERAHELPQFERYPGMD